MGSEGGGRRDGVVSSEGGGRRDGVVSSEEGGRREGVLSSEGGGWNGGGVGSSSCPPFMPSLLCRRPVLSSCCRHAS